MKSRRLDNLGLIAGMIEELGFVNSIDSYIDQDINQRKISIGESVKAMILNSLGFINSQLYTVSDFFEKLPVEKLFKDGVKASHFNDDVLGRSLDSLYKNDICQLFTIISTKACKVLNLKSQTFHVDSTSFHTHGDHINKDVNDTNVIKLVQGYSRDFHPELNQVVLEMIANNCSGIPLAMKPLSGNANDNKEFPKIINEFAKNLQYSELEPITFVADSAFYSHKNISELSENIKFITRVPNRSKEVLDIYKSIDINELTIIDDDYSFKEFTSNYGGKTQRWIVFFSQQAHNKKLKTFEKKLKKDIDLEKKNFNKISSKEFACKEDAIKDLTRFMNKSKYLICKDYDIIEHKKYKTKGRPDKTSEYIVYYELKANFSLKNDVIDAEKSKIGLFVLSTNHLEEYTAEEVLKLYKEQGKVERGFRFLKDHTFMASSIYLEKPQRIEALMFVMCLCLMVYSALEHRIREGLKNKNLYYPNQLKKLIQNPTARWIFYNFYGIEVLYYEDKRFVINKNTNHDKIINILGDNYVKYYS